MDTYLHDNSSQKVVEASLERHGMLRFGSRLGVAVSGGADSVFLLHALSGLGLAAAVLHINHGLRGSESDGDEAFVRELAQRFGLPFHAAAPPIAEGNLEQEARRARYAFFAEILSAGHCDAVATGHTLDDQAETLVSRFLRGAGTAGLAGVRPVSESRIVRPLLALRRHDIRAWLTENGIAWREDRTNTDPEFERNRIRLEAMPLLLAFNPSLPAVLASTAEWAQGEEDYWSRELDRLELAHFAPDREAILLRIGPFLELPPAVQRRLLRRAIERVRGSLRSIDFRHIAATIRLMEAPDGSGRLQIPGLDVYRSFDWLRLAPPGFDAKLERDFEIILEIPGRTALPERRLDLEMELVPRAGVYNKQMNALDWGLCSGTLALRNWRPGDRYRPVGRSGEEKIKTLFQESRVPLWERRTWPVVVRGNEILWTRRFGPSGDFAAGPESERILVIREAEESTSSVSASTEMYAEPASQPAGRGNRNARPRNPAMGGCGAEVL